MSRLFSQLYKLIVNKVKVEMNLTGSFFEPNQTSIRSYGKFKDFVSNYSFLS